jgi:hypothetical protein
MSQVRFIQEAPHHTNIEGVHPEWIAKWTRAEESTTVLLLQPIGRLSWSVLELFESAFNDVSYETVLRLVAADEADRLSDEVSNASPPPTGAWIDGTKPNWRESGKEQPVPRLRKLINELVEWLDVTYE